MKSGKKKKKNTEQCVSLGKNAAALLYSCPVQVWAALDTHNWG